MSLLRIYAAPAEISGAGTAGTERAGRYQWVSLGKGHDSVKGEGRLDDLPRDADKVQLVLPAQQVLIARTRLPPEARRRAGSTAPILAFAVEDQIIGEPDDHQVSWLGSVDAADLLAVIDKRLVERWRTALAGAGIRDYEIHSEALLLPRSADEWSMAWQGSEGFIRIGEREGMATDQGSRTVPPQILRLLLKEAEVQGTLPAAIALYTSKLGATPDAEAWQRSLGVPIRLAGPWTWRSAPLHAGIMLVQQQQGWKALSGILTRLRLPAMIAAGAMAIHACALLIDWGLLARQQRLLRQGMETQFRSTFPEAVAVVDPVLQMRRKLAEKRQSVGQADEGDFLPMVEKIAAGMNELPPGKLRVMAYESGRMTLEVGDIDTAAAQRVAERLKQAGLQAEVSPAPAGETGGPQATTIVVRIS